MRREGRKGEWNEYVEFGYGTAVKFIAQKSRDNHWYIYFINRKTAITIGNAKSKREAAKLAEIASRVYFEICS